MDDKQLKKFCRFLLDIVFAVITAFTISYIFFAQVLQQGFSMTPTINDHGVCIVNRLYHYAFSLNRNDIIAFNVGNNISIKRIYGLPGETISLINGELYINDIKFEKNKYINSLSSNIEQNIKLGDDEYYVLGDNPDSSKDSRFLDVGNIKRHDIIGKVWYIVKQ